MIPLNPHAVNSSLLALPAAVAITRKLLRERKTPVTNQANSPTDQMNQDERTANTFTESLKKIVGYPHHGLNE